MDEIMEARLEPPPHEHPGGSLGALIVTILGAAAVIAFTAAAWLMFRPA